jgi:hypothetical protein
MRSPQMTYEGVRQVIQRTYPAYDVEIRDGEYCIAGAAPLVVAPGDRFAVPDVLPGFSFIVDELWPQ